MERNSYDLKPTHRQTTTNEPVVIENNCAVMERPTSDTFSDQKKQSDKRSKDQRKELPVLANYT